MSTYCRQKRANIDGRACCWRGNGFAPLSEQSEGDSLYTIAGRNGDTLLPPVQRSERGGAQTSRLLTCARCKLMRKGGGALASSLCTVRTMAPKGKGKKGEPVTALQRGVRVNLTHASTAKVTSLSFLVTDAGAGDEAGPGKLKPAQQLKVRERSFWKSAAAVHARHDVLEERDDLDKSPSVPHYGLCQRSATLCLRCYLSLLVEIKMRSSHRAFELASDCGPRTLKSSSPPPASTHPLREAEQKPASTGAVTSW